ncbi:MAG: bile acid:sodium symporter family protein [Fibrobacteria bacterium]|nr:bile acid:sodium symporter family protein [Fibrobacteria bacterium]
MNKVLDIYNRLFALWVVIAGVSALLWPWFFIPLKGGMELFFAITMFGVGMTLKTDNFFRVFKDYKAVIIGVVAQFTIMPLLAFFIAKSFSFSEAFALGLILAGSAPGAMASNVLSYLAGADVAYSVSLTTVSTLLAPVLTPLLTLFLAHTYLDIPFWSMFFSVTKMVLAPLLLGIILKKIMGEKLDTFSKVFPAVSTTFIAFICALVIALNRAYLYEMSLWIMFAVVLLNILGLLAGYGVGHISRFDLLKKRALSIEIGMQNAGLGSVLALKHFNAQTALPAVLFVFVCIFSASFLVQLWAGKQTA